MRFKLGCRLKYQTAANVPFVFNVHAQRCDGQIIAHERLTLTPSAEIEHWTMPESGNRYFRMISPVGPFAVEYEAEATLAPLLDDPAAVSEIPVQDLPLAVLTHLYPSRYCQSDKLERFAQSTFGAIEHGYSRVNGICNWIHDYVEY